MVLLPPLEFPELNLPDHRGSISRRVDTRSIITWAPVDEARIAPPVLWDPIGGPETADVHRRSSA